MPKRKPVSNKHTRKPRRASAKAPAPITNRTFPATEQTPGQARSRIAFEALQAKRAQCAWWNDFLRLMQEGGLDWRKAAYVAWASSPLTGRWPPTLKELAEQVLGCSDRVIRKWRAMNPALDELVAKAQIEPLMLHRRDVIEALVTVASTADTYAHSDRKLFLEMTGDYRPRGSLALTGKDGGPIQTEDVGLTDDERANRITALLDAARARRDRQAAERDQRSDVDAPAGTTDGGVSQPGG